MSIYLNWMSDAGLVRRTLAGNRDAFGALVMRHHAMAHALAWGHTGSATDADDVVQEAFLKAFTKLDTLREAEKFAGWLAGIVRNLAADLRIRRARVDAVSLDAVASIPAPAPRIEDEEIYALLRDTVFALEEPAREVLTLHYFARKSLREVAEIQGITREAAMKRLQRARETLGKSLLDKLDHAQLPTRQTDARKRAIIALVASAPVAWKAAAATGVTIGATAIVLGIVAALASLGVAGYEYRQDIEEYFRGASAASAMADASVSPATSVLEGAAPPAQSETETNAVATAAGGEGPGTFSGRIMDVSGRPVSGVTLKLEHVDWPRREIPPAKTKRYETVSDESGHYVVGGLPLGEYSLLAFSGNAIDVIRGSIQKEALEKTEDLYLKPGLPITGRVLKAGGEPVAGAVIYPAIYAPLGPIDDATTTSAVRVYSDEQGQFRFGLLWPGGWKFTARAPGFANSMSDQFEAGSHGNVITLQRGATVHGTVVSEKTHRPIQGIRVTLAATTPSAETRAAESGMDGTFTMEGVAPGEYHPIVYQGAAVLKEGPTSLTIESDGDYPLDLVVGGGASITGRVYDKATGEGLAGVPVLLECANAVSSVVTDAVGGYIFPIVPSGAGSVSFSEGRGYYAVGSSRSPIYITGEKEYEINLPAARGIPLRGMVVDAAGQPVAGAQLSLEPLNPIAIGPSFAYESQPDGSFETWTREAGDGVRLLAVKNEMYSKRVTIPSVSPQGASGLVLRLELAADAVVEAQIETKGLEQQLAAQMVVAHLEPQDGGFFHANEVILPPNGFARFEAVLPGTYAVNFVNKNTGNALCKTDPFDVASGKVVKGIKGECGGGGDFTITGVVKSTMGDPIPGAEVALLYDPNNRQVTCGPDGAFTIDGLTEGRYYLAATAANFLGGDTQAQAGDGHIEILLKQARNLHGHVRDADSGAPLANSGARPVDADRAPKTLPELYAVASLQGFTPPGKESDGAFGFPWVAGVTAYVVARAPGYVPAVQEVDAEDDQDIEIALKKAGSVSGVVHAPGGAPLSGVFVSTNPTNRFYPFSSTPDATTDTAGAFTYDGIVPGAPLYFFHPEYALTTGIVTAEGTLEVVMEAGGALSGRVVPCPPGGVVGSLHVEVVLSSGALAVTDEIQLHGDGTFHAERLPEGTARVAMRVAAANTPVFKFPESPTAVVVNGQETTIVVDATGLLEPPLPEESAAAATPEAQP